MHRRLYGCLELDETHNHITKRIVSSSDKPSRILLTMMLRKNQSLFEDNCLYSQSYSENFSKVEESPLYKMEQGAKKATAPCLSRRKLESFRKVRKRSQPKVQQELQLTYGPIPWKKSERKQLQMSKFEMSHLFEAHENERSSNLVSESSEKQNRDKPCPEYKSRFFGIRNETSGANVVRYSALLHPLNLDRTCQHRLPEIPLSRRLQQLYGRNILKRVQFA